MEDNKKIKRLLEKKEKVEAKVKRIHKLVFKDASQDNTELRILRSEYDKAKKQLDKINGEIEQLRQKYEDKTSKPKKAALEIVTKETIEPKESSRPKEIIKLVDNANKNVDKLAQKPIKPVQSIKPTENKKVEETTTVVEPEKQKEDKQEDKKPEQNIETPNETENKPETKSEEAKKPKIINEKIKINVANIKVPQKIEPKPIIPSERLR